MKAAWLNLVLELTNKIYQKKQLVLNERGFQVVILIFGLIFLEIALAMVSAPLYVSMRSGDVTAYLGEKGKYGKIAFDYSLRRILTLTGLGMICVIWAVKLGLILFVPRAFGPLQLYRISALQPVDVMDQGLIQTETAIQTARMDPSMPKAELTEVRRVGGGGHIFSGTGRPSLRAVLFLTNQNMTVYYADVEKDGHWRVEHSEKDFVMSEGNHGVSVFLYDPQRRIRGQISDVQYFKVTPHWTDRVVRNVDTLANGTAAAIIVMGALITFLTI